LRSRNEKNTIQRQRLERFPRQDEMAVVNGIEAAAEDADFFQN
jgi:hypothetical protein